MHVYEQECLDRVHELKTDSVWIKFSIYSTASVSGLILICLLFNSYTILYKQGKWRVVPLVKFYILSVMLVIFKILNAIFIVEIVCRYDLIGCWTSQYLCFSISLVVSWMICELFIRVTVTIKCIRDSYWQPSDKIAKILPCGRIILSIFIILFLSSAETILLIKN